MVAGCHAGPWQRVCIFERIEAVMIDRRSLTYFREEFVVRRRWLDEQAYADLVGCASSCPAPPAARSDFPSGS